MATSTNSFWDESEQSLVDLFKQKHLAKKQSLLAMAQSLQLEGSSSRRSTLDPDAPVLTKEILQQVVMQAGRAETISFRKRSGDAIADKENLYQELPCKQAIQNSEDAKQDQIEKVAHPAVKDSSKPTSSRSKPHRSQSQLQEYSYLDQSTSMLGSPKTEHGRSEITDLTLLAEDSLMRDSKDHPSCYPVTRTLEYSTDEGNSWEVSQLDLSSKCAPSQMAKKGTPYQNSNHQQSTEQPLHQTSLELGKLHKKDGASQPPTKSFFLFDAEHDQGGFGTQTDREMVHLLQPKASQPQTSSVVREELPSEVGNQTLETSTKQEVSEEVACAVEELTSHLRRSVWETNTQRSTPQTCSLLTGFLNSRLIVLLGSRVQQALSRDLLTDTKHCGQHSTPGFVVTFVKDIAIAGREDPQKAETLLQKARSILLILEGCLDRKIRNSTEASHGQKDLLLSSLGGDTATIFSDQRQTIFRDLFDEDEGCIVWEQFWSNLGWKSDKETQYGSIIVNDEAEQWLLYPELARESATVSIDALLLAFWEHRGMLREKLLSGNYLKHLLNNACKKEQVQVVKAGNDLPQINTSDYISFQAIEGPSRFSNSKKSSVGPAPQEREFTSAEIIEQEQRLGITGDAEVDQIVNTILDTITSRGEDSFLFETLRNGAPEGFEHVRNAVQLEFGQKISDDSNKMDAIVKNLKNLMSSNIRQKLLSYSEERRKRSDSDRELDQPPEQEQFPQTAGNQTVWNSIYEDDFDKQIKIEALSSTQKCFPVRPDEDLSAREKVQPTGARSVTGVGNQQARTRTPSPASILKQPRQKSASPAKSVSGSCEKQVRFDDKKSRDIEARLGLCKSIYRRLPALLDRLFQGKLATQQMHRHSQHSFIGLMEVFVECVSDRDLPRWVSVGLRTKPASADDRTSHSFYSACDAYEYLAKLAIGDRDTVLSALEELELGLYDQYCAKVVVCVLQLYQGKTAVQEKSATKHKPLRD